ncbi:MAG: hypothetical protein K8E24_000145, partial [Methanobacterium paludis]|nr:hypothetical protein [Methanobacterium paludis]
MADEHGKMSFEEYKEQDLYCRLNNPEGKGCDACLGNGKVCADNVKNLADKLNHEKPLMYVVN